MSDKVHRVVVSLTDAMHKLSKSARECPLDSEVKILDKTTLLLRMSNENDAVKSSQRRYYQQLQFDAVGYEDERHVRDELSELLAQMFRLLRHGCLLRLTPRRAYNVKLLTRLLVSEVDKLIQELSYRLDGINVEYYDVRKFDMINMLSTLNNRGNKEQGKGGRKMQTTREMFQWLHNEYSVLRGRGTGDDYINVEFLLSDGQQKRHKLHLALFQIFDCNERKDVTNFFKSLPLQKRSHSTLLADCIKESFDYRQGAVFTLVLCELPLDREGAREMHKFLKLANLACMSINAAYKKRHLQMKTAISHSLLEKKSKVSSSTELVNVSKQRSLRNIEAASPRCRLINLSGEDYGKLASWYQRIDTKFAEVKSCMERHYNVQYRQKFLKICKQLHTSRAPYDKSGGDAQRILLQNSNNDLAATANYVEALKQFRQLEKEANKSIFACTLSTYMNTKNFELLNVEKGLQKQEIANLREHRSRL